MKQVIRTISRHLSRGICISGILLFAFIQPSFSQSSTLNVQFDLTSISDTVSFRGENAHFPYYVMSLISVRDENNHYVHGLADTSKWLYPTDSTQSHELVDNVWNTILERHESNLLLPPDPDVKHTDSLYKVTEVLDVKGFGLAVANVMDYSGSMGDDIYKAESASRTFVQQMTPNDRAAIIKFTGKVQTFQAFTTDTTALMEAITEQPEDREYTALYDALHVAISQALSQPGRQVVVAYTDGKDNISTHTASDVITLAKTNDIPVYLIGLGDQVDPVKLQDIADQTGGYYWGAPTVDDLASIYVTIFGLIRGYYVLAHTSPDPINNGTWRLVDVTLDSKSKSGSGQGRYYVPYIAPDLKVIKTIDTDSTGLWQNESVDFAAAEDTITFHITLTNIGVGVAPNVRLTDWPQDSIDILSISSLPEIEQGDSLSWFYPYLYPGDTIQISYTAKIADKMPMGGTYFSSAAQAYSQLDSTFENNRDDAALVVLGLADLSPQCIPVSGLVSPTYPVELSSIISNHGHADASIPFEIDYTIQNTSMPSLVRDTVSFLNLSDTYLSKGTLIFPEEGTYTVSIKADATNVVGEEDESNNICSTLVQAGIDSLWMRISDITLTDVIRESYAQFPEKIFSRIFVGDQNDHVVHGLAKAGEWAGIEDASDRGVTIGDYWIQLQEYHRDNPEDSPNPDVRPGMQITEITDSPIAFVLMQDFSVSLASWNTALDGLWADYLNGYSASDASAVYSMNAQPSMIQDFTNSTATLQSALNQPFDDTSRHLYDAIDLAMQSAQSKAGRNGIFLITGGADQGSSISAPTLITNSQKSGVPVFILHLSAVHSESLDSLARACGGWYTLASSESACATAFNRMEDFFRDFYVIAHASPDTIQNQNWRTVDVSLAAFNLTASDNAPYQVPLGYADLGITKTNWGASVTIAGGDSLQSVQPGDSVHVRLTFENLGHHTVQDIRVTDILPSNLIPAYFDPQPVSIGGTIEWHFDSLAIREKEMITYTCFVDTLSSEKRTLLINTAEVICTGDFYTYNNIAKDTLTYIPLTDSDLIVTKYAVGDSLSIVNGDSLWYVHANSRIHYSVRVENAGEKYCGPVYLSDVLPKYLSFETFEGAPISAPENTYSWTVDKLDSRGDYRIFTYTCKIDSLIPPWGLSLTNTFTARCGEDSASVRDTVYTVGLVPPNPQIRVSPTLIEPLDSVAVQVYTPIPVEAGDWDLIVRFEDGYEIDTYGDAFIASHDLSNGVWIDVSPDFAETLMRTSKDEEQVDVILETSVYWDGRPSVKRDTASFRIRSSDEFFLDENTYRPGDGHDLGLRFKLSSNRWTEIRIYDISGAFVRKAVDGFYNAGWNRDVWDGRDESGRPMGSGLYVAILISGDFHKAHKFILVR